MIVEGHKKYIVKQVLNSKHVQGKLYYLVTWEGCGPEEQSWELADHVHAHKLVQAFHQRHPEKPSPKLPERQPRDVGQGGVIVRASGQSIACESMAVSSPAYFSLALVI